MFYSVNYHEWPWSPNSCSFRTLDMGPILRNVVSFESIRHSTWHLENERTKAPKLKREAGENLGRVGVKEPLSRRYNSDPLPFVRAIRLF